MSVNITTILGEVYPLLGAAGSADLLFWTTDELYIYADQASQKLARSSGAFVDRDLTSIDIVAGTSEYSLPARAIEPIHASFDEAQGVAPLDPISLRPATIEELEAGSADWESVINTPRRFVRKPGIVRLYPTPIVDADAWLVLRQYPAAVTSGSPTVPAPACLGDYWRFNIVAEARGKESVAAMPEVKAWVGRLLGLYEDAARSYWGEV